MKESESGVRMHVSRFEAGQRHVAHAPRPRRASHRARGCMHMGPCGAGLGKCALRLPTATSDRRRGNAARARAAPAVRVHAGGGRLAMPAAERVSHVQAGERGAPMTHAAMPAAGARAAVIFLHGTGDDEYGLLPIASLLQKVADAEGFPVSAVSARGRLDIEGGGARHFEGYSSRPEPIALEKTVAESAETLLELTAWVREAYDVQHVALWGFSQGATISYAALCRGWPERALVSAAVCSSGVLFSDVEDPLTRLGRDFRMAAQSGERLAGVPLLCSHGEYDQITPPTLGAESAARAARILTPLGARVEAFTAPEGHTVCGVEQSAKFLVEALAAASTP